MKRSLPALALSAAFPWGAAPALAQDAPELAKSLGVVTVNSGRPTSLPTQIPTTIEGITGEQVQDTINATDSEDALKYLPSLLVRKRYIGDYNHAILSSRASGTGNSARSAVYADGILLSNYLGNGIANGSNFAPRWGLVTPEEIERVDVMYGPFSAAYPGNSAGAIVDYVTRMPTQLEAHVKAGYFSQPFDLYNTHKTFDGWQSSASIGSKSGDWSWWIDVNRTDSRGQPLTFPTRLLSAGTPGSAGTPVTGAVAALDRGNNPWYILGTATEYHTVQDHAKLKLAYDFSPTVRATYTLGWWQNSSEGRPDTYLRNAAGQPVYSGLVNIGGRSFNLSPSDYNLSNETQTQVMHGLSVKSNTRGEWDWEVTASLFDYANDKMRVPTIALPLAASGGAGTLQDQDGTGWNTLAARGTWRPQGSAHVVDFGVQRDAYKLRILKSNVVGDWQDGPPGTPATDVGGRSELRSLWAQDSWAFAPKWKSVLGLRFEDWRAEQGFSASGAARLGYGERHESHVSPKVALAYQWLDDTVLKASAGRAVRMPTVGELYGATSGGALSFINDPNLRPERSWTSELTAEKDLGNAFARATLFHETTRDALYSQLIPGSTTVSRVQNIDRMRTTGVELAYQGNDVFIKGVDLGGSLTYADSRIAANAAFPASVGKQQPRVPALRATAVATWRPDARWAVTVAARYSGKQYSTLDNSDINGFAYTAASKYFTVDWRVRYRIDKHWSAALGIDNANNYQYWNFHPYPQRTYTAELRVDL